MRRLHICFVFYLVYLTLPLQSDAIDPKPHPEVRAEFFHSDAVISGVVVSQEAEIDKNGDCIGWIYNIQVDKVFKGEAAHIIRVSTTNYSARLMLEVGSAYLLFARQHDGILMIYGGGNSALLSESQDAISEIEKIGSIPNGTIKGMVASRPGWTGVGGVIFDIHGRLGVYRVISDKSGWFEISVAPGQYSVKSLNPRIEVFDFSYDSPDGFYLHKGGCVMLQFVVDM